MQAAWLPGTPSCQPWVGHSAKYPTPSHRRSAWRL